MFPSRCVHNLSHFYNTEYFLLHQFYMQLCVREYMQLCVWEGGEGRRGRESLMFQLYSHDTSNKHLKVKNGGLLKHSFKHTKFVTVIFFYFSENENISQFFYQCHRKILWLVISDKIKQNWPSSGMNLLRNKLPRNLRIS